MQHIVTDLVETLNARAVLLVAKDGMIVACEVREGLDPHRVGALCAALVAEVTTALAGQGLEGFRQLEVAAERGKLIVVEAASTWLIVLVGARLEIGPESIELRSAAQRVVKESNLTSA